MAIKLTPTYTSQYEYLLGNASSSKYFDEQQFANLADNESKERYLYIVNQAANKDTSAFSVDDLKYLSIDEQESLLANEFVIDRNLTDTDAKTGEQYNIYERNKQVLDSIIEEGILTDQYNKLSLMEKIFTNTGGVLGNASVALLDIVEGVGKIVPLVIGAASKVFGEVTEAFGGDATGYEGLERTSKAALASEILPFSDEYKQNIAEYVRKYTEIDENKILGVVNDVTSAIIQMTPLALNLVVPGLGTGIYYAGMAGSTATSTIQSNPNIDSLTLLAYTGATTGIEVATERLSGVLFGSSFIDNMIFGKSVGKATGRTLLGKLGIDFLSEGAEEFVAEIAGSLIYKGMIDPTAKAVDIKSALYAGLIGGIVGFGMSSGSIAATKRLGVTTDNQLKELRTAKKSEFKEILTRMQTINLKNTLSASESSLYKETSMDRLIKQYPEMSRSQIQNQYKSEYATAQRETLDQQKRMIASATGLTKLMEIMGVENFTKAVKVLDTEVESRLNSMRTFASNYNGSAKLNALEKQFTKQHLNQATIRFQAPTSTLENNLRNNMKSDFDINMEFVEFGEVDGFNNTDFRAVTLYGDTVLVKSGLVNELGLEGVANLIVKEELAHTLQFDSSGVITANSLSDVDFLFKALTGTSLTRNVELDDSYKKESALAKIAEKQAQALSQALLFDSVTVSNLFKSNKGLIYNARKWIKKYSDQLYLGNKKGKLKFQFLNKALKDYNKVFAENIGNLEDVNDIAERADLNETDRQELIDQFLADYSNEHYSLVKYDNSPNTIKRMKVEKILSYNRKDINKLLPLYYRNCLTAEYFTDAFVNKINRKIDPLGDFEYNMQKYLIDNYDTVVSKTENTLLEIVDLNDEIQSEFLDALSAIGKTDIKQLNLSYETLADLFNDDFNSRFINADGTNSLDDINVEFVPISEKTNTLGFYDKITNTIVVYINSNYVNNSSYVNELLHSLYHETHHALANLQGLQNGTSVSYVRQALAETSDMKTIDTIAKIIFTQSFYDENKNNLNGVLDDIAYGVYRITDGEYAAENYLRAKGREGDDITRFKASHYLNKTGFSMYNGTLVGRGRLKDIELKATASYQETVRVRNEVLKKTREIVAYSKKTRNEVRDILTQNNVAVSKENGFSPQFISLYTNNRLNQDTIINLFENGNIGTNEAQNIILQTVFKDNNIKDVETMERLFDFDLLSLVGLEESNRRKTNTLFPELKPTDVISQDMLQEYIKMGDDTLIKASDITEKWEGNNYNLDIVKAYIIKNDFNYTLSDIRKFRRTASGQFGLVADLKTLALDSTDAETGLIDVLEDTSMAVDKETQDDVISEDLVSAITTQSTETFESFISNVILNETIMRDNQKVESSFDMLTRAFTALDSIVESKDLDVNSVEYKKIQSLKDVDLFIDALKSALNSVEKYSNDYFRIRNRINKYKVDLKTIYGENGYQKILDLLPLTKQSVVSTLKTQIKKEISKIDNATISQQDKAVLDFEYTTVSEPKALEEYIEKIKKIVPSKPKTVAVKKSKVDILDGSKQTQNIEPVSTPIETQTTNSLTKNVLSYTVDPKGAIEALKTTKTFGQNYQYEVRSFEAWLDQNISYLHQLNDENVQNIIQEARRLRTDNLEYETTYGFLMSYLMERSSLFNDTNRAFIDKYTQNAIVAAPQVLRGFRAALEKLDPLYSVVNDVKRDFGVDITFDDSVVNEFTDILQNKDAEIEKLRKELSDVTKKLDAKPDFISEAELNIKAKRLMDKLTMLLNNDNIGLLDSVLQEALDLGDIKKARQIIKRAVENISKQVEGTKKLSDTELKRFLRKMNKFRYFSMLSAPVTAIRNLVGNIGMTGLNFITTQFEKQISNVVDFKQTQYKMTGKSNEKISKHIEESLGKKAELLMESSKYDDSSKSKIARELSNEIDKLFPGKDAISKGLQWWADKMNWALTYGDTVFTSRLFVKTFADMLSANVDKLRLELSTLYTTQQLEILKNKNKEKYDSIQKAIKGDDIELLKNIPNATYTTLMNMSMFRAGEVYFRNENAFSKWINESIKKNPALGLILAPIIPFPKVASNILLTTFKYSPLNFIRGAIQLSNAKTKQDLEFYTGQAVRNISEGLVGSFMYVAGAILASLGAIKIDDDDNMGVVLVLGDLKIRLSDLAPSLTPLSMGATLVALEEGTFGERVQEMMLTLYDQTMLNNMNSLLEYNRSLTDVGETMALSYFNQYIPSLVKALSRIFDPSAKDRSGNFFEKLLKQTAASIPGVSFAVPNKIDPYTGEVDSRFKFLPRAAEFFYTFFPIQMIDDSRKSEIEQEAISVDAKTTGSTGKFKINGEEYELTNVEKQKFSEHRGKYVNDLLSDLYNDKIKVTVKDDDRYITTYYSKMTDKQKTNATQNIYTKATEYSKIEYWTNRGNIYITQDYDQYKYLKSMGLNNVRYKSTHSGTRYVEK